MKRAGMAKTAAQFRSDDRGAVPNKQFHEDHDIRQVMPLVLCQIGEQ